MLYLVIWSKFIMSRIGKLPIKIPANVEITWDKSDLIVKGKFGILQNTIPEILQINKTDDILVVSLKNNTRTNNALYGLYRTLINNMVIGVSEQFKLNLTLKGVGYRGSVQGNTLVLNLGYSHPVKIQIPDEISVEVIKNTTLNFKSCDKELLGLFASKVIHNTYPPCGELQ